MAAPILLEGRVAGAVVRMWEPGAHRFEIAPMLAPFLLMLACLVLAAAQLTARAVRRAAVAPLDALARFAKLVAERGWAQPIRLRSGDEFEALADAFDTMISRLNAQMRRIQEIADADARLDGLTVEFEARLGEVDCEPPDPLAERPQLERGLRGLLRLPDTVVEYVLVHQDRGHPDEQHDDAAKAIALRHEMHQLRDAVMLAARHGDETAESAAAILAQARKDLYALLSA